MSTFGRKERGAAVVELALLLPVLILILGLIVDFGLRFERTTLINNAAQIAARDVAIHHGAGDQPTKAQSASGAPAGSVFVSLPTTCTSGDPVSVTITKTYDRIPFFGGTYTATGTGVAQCSG